MRFFAAMGLSQQMLLFFYCCKQAVVTDTSFHHMSWTLPVHSYMSFPGCFVGCVMPPPHFKINVTLNGLTNDYKVLLSILVLADSATEGTVVCLTCLLWFPCEVTSTDKLNMPMASVLLVSVYLMCCWDQKEVWPQLVTLNIDNCALSLSHILCLYFFSYILLCWSHHHYLHPESVE